MRGFPYEIIQDKHQMAMGRYAQDIKVNFVNKSKMVTVTLIVESIGIFCYLDYSQKRTKQLFSSAALKEYNSCYCKYKVVIELKNCSFLFTKIFQMKKNYLVCGKAFCLTRKLDSKIVVKPSHIGHNQCRVPSEHAQS